MQVVDLSGKFLQTTLADLVGVSQPAISAMVSEGKLPGDGTLGEVLLAYCQRLRAQAAGRLGADAGGLDLVQERAALAREQRIAQALKNAVARGEYAPIGLLGDVLGMASSAVVDRMEQVDGQLRKACPDLPEVARNTVLAVLANARNEWIRATTKLVAERVDVLLQDPEDDALLPDADADLAETDGGDGI